MKKALFSILIFIMLTTPVTALQNGNTDNTTGKKNAPTEIPRCSVVTQRVELITSRYKNNKDRYINAYQRIETNVTKFVTKLKSNGYDVAKLETDLTELRTMIKNAGQYYDQFQTGLNNSKSYACGNSQGDFKVALNTARENLRLARAEMLKIRTFIQTTLREDLQAMRAKIATV